jgi:hypothetical protein
MRQAMMMVLAFCFSITALPAETLKELAQTPIGVEHAKKLRARIEASVKAGDISSSQGTSLAMTHHHASVLSKYEQEINAGLKAGNTTPKVAAAYFAHFKEMAPINQAIYDRRIDRLIKLDALQPDIKAGKLTEQQADAQVAFRYNSRHWPYRLQQDIISHTDNKRRTAIRRAENKTTEEQAQQYSKKYREAYIAHKVRSAWSPVNRATQGKVKSGEITQAQAREILDKAKKRFTEHYTKQIEQLEAFSEKKVSLGRLSVASYALADTGMTEQQVTLVFDAMLETVEMAREKGTKFVLPKTVTKYLRDSVSLKPEQVTAVAQQIRYLVEETVSATGSSRGE